MKQLADYGNKGLKPESEFKAYEFGNGTKAKKAGKGANKDGASAVGKIIAQRALEKGVKDVVFDRGGYMYHGRVKALADAAREGGLTF